MSADCIPSIIALLLICVQPATAPATQPGEFERQLEEIDRRAGLHQDLVADFVQEKRSPMLRRPLVSRGSVKAKGGLVLWETTEPERTLMSIDPQTLRLYYPQQKTIEEYPMQRELGMMAASPLPRLGAIRQSFKLVPDDGEGLPRPEDRAGRLRPIKLLPIDESVAQYVAHVRVLLDAERGMVLAFELVDPDGELTLITFTNLRASSGLTDDDLKLPAVQGVKVVRPLEGQNR